MTINATYYNHGTVQVIVNLYETQFHSPKKEGDASLIVFF